MPHSSRGPCKIAGRGAISGLVMGVCKELVKRIVIEIKTLVKGQSLHMFHNIVDKLKEALLFSRLTYFF